MDAVERLRKLLVQSKLSQNKFARKIGVTPSYLSHVLCGRRLPGPKILAAIGITLRKSYEKVKVAK